MKKLSKEDRVTELRWLCRNDLFFLLVYVLNRQDADQDWLFDRCREIQAAPNGRLDLWAREHFKSSIITFALTIQDILRTHGFDANRDEITIGLFSQTRPIAKKFMLQIMRELETNENLKTWFPDVLYANPKKDSPKWSEDEGIIVRRKGNPKEGTLEAWGLVDGLPAGPHYGLRLYDDTVTEKSVTTPEMIQKTTHHWELSLSLGTQAGVDRYVGTRYFFNDTYDVMMKRGVIPRIYAATKDGTDDTRPENCVFMPSWLLTQKLQKMGKKTFSTQMLLNPKGGQTAGFLEEWLRYWPRKTFTNLKFLILVDPASKKKKSSDFTAIWALGLGSDGHWYVCDYIHDKLNLMQRVNTVMALHRRYKQLGNGAEVMVGWEEYGLQADIEACKWQQETKNYRFAITELGGQMPKEDRINRLQAVFQNNRIWMPEGGCIHTNYEGIAVDTIKVFITDEYGGWPVIQHDDGLDCLSRIEDPEIKLHMQPPVEDEPPPSKWMAETIAEHMGNAAGVSWQGR